MSSTVIVLGATGYMGQTFAQELEARGHSVKRLSRKQVDYARFDVLLKYLREAGPDFLVNAAGYTGKPNVDACEIFKADTLVGNTLLPQTIAHACEAAGVPWGHVSSGCIYSGAKIGQGGQVRTEKDLNTPELKALVAGGGKGIHGFIETDPPNFSFRDPPCSFYSGTKALAEEAIAGIGRSYIWRLRIPFDEFDNPRNYLSKVQRYSKVYDNVNSISHRSDFTRACLDLWERRAPWGTYNVTNPGFVTTRQVVELIQEILKPNRRFEFWLNDEEFYRVAAKTPRSNCVLDNSKLFSAGVRIRPVLEALRDSLRQWQPEKKT
jgi:dTDP-4-dehydrorhamnose reductase